MLELTNKRSTYDVSGSSDTLSIVGQVSVTPALLIDSFAGQFKNADGDYIGSFLYSEHSNGKITKTLSDMVEGVDIAAFALLAETISEVKSSIID